MSHNEGRRCLCQATHRPAPLEFERHHIWPLGLDGPDTDDNIVWVCPTTHTNIHEILRIFMRFGLVSFYDIGAQYTVPVSKYAYQVAKEGFIRWVSGASYLLEPSEF